MARCRRRYMTMAEKTPYHLKGVLLGACNCDWGCPCNFEAPPTYGFELDQARAYAESLIKNAPDPVFVSDLEGKIHQANDAVSELLGFRPDELLEQSLSRFISNKEKREFTAALRAVVEHGVTRNAVLHPRSASGEVIPTTLNASALHDP